MAETTPNCDTPSRRPISEGELAALPKFPNLTLTDRLGSGGFGTVYAADHHLLQSKVAVKILRHSSADPKWAARFQKEAHALSRLVHPNIVRVYSFAISEEQNAVLVMEYLKGSSLQRTIQKHGVLSPEKAVEVMVHLCDAVQHAHDNSIIHRDLKPSNIVITENGAPKLLDFGVAKVSINEQEQKLTATGQLMGTPSYMSPEQCWGKPATQSSDIYSLCGILYFMLTGKCVFEGSDAEVMLKHCHDEPQINDPTIPPGIKSIIVKGLAKKPEDRFQSCSDLGKVLQQAELALSPQTKKNPVVLTACALLLIAIIGTVIYFAKDSKSNTASYASDRSTGPFSERAFVLDYEKASDLHIRRNPAAARKILEKWQAKGFPSSQQIHHLENMGLLAVVLADLGETASANKLASDILDFVKSKEFRAASRLSQDGKKALELKSYQTGCDVFTTTKNYPAALNCLEHLKASLENIKSKEIDVAPYWNSYYTNRAKLYELTGNGAARVKACRERLQYAIAHTAAPEELADRYRELISAELVNHTNQQDIRKTVLDFEKLITGSGDITDITSFIDQTVVICGELEKAGMKTDAIRVGKLLNTLCQRSHMQLTQTEQLHLLKRKIEMGKGWEQIFLGSADLTQHKKIVLSQLDRLSKLPTDERPSNFHSSLADAVECAMGLSALLFESGKRAAIAFRDQCVDVLKKRGLLSTSQVAEFSRAFYVPNSQLPGYFLSALEQEIQSSDGNKHFDSNSGQVDDSYWVDAVHEVGSRAFAAPTVTSEELLERADVLRFHQTALRKIRAMPNASSLLRLRCLNEEARAMLAAYKIVAKNDELQIQKEFLQELQNLEQVDESTGRVIGLTLMYFSGIKDVLVSEPGKSTPFILNIIDCLERKQFFHSRILHLYSNYAAAKTALASLRGNTSELQKLNRRQNELLDINGRLDDDDSLVQSTIVSNMALANRYPGLAEGLTKKCYLRLKRENSNTSLHGRLSLLNQLTFFFTYLDTFAFTKREFLEYLELAKQPSDLHVEEFTHLVDAINNKHLAMNQQSAGIKYLDQVAQKADRSGLAERVTVNGAPLKKWLQWCKTRMTESVVNSP